MQETIDVRVRCFHCGDDCRDESIVHDSKTFCCEGCKLVFEILQENNLCSYYQLNNSPGTSAKNKVREARYLFLDDETVKKLLIGFTDGSTTHVTFRLPQIHCSSCIWLLENFKRVDAGVIQSKVNFLKKEVTLVYDESRTGLRKIVEALTSLGYEPDIHLDSIEKKVKKKTNRSRIIRIGVAGFCFANIMMLSFPDYFSSGNVSDPGLKKFFSILILVLSLPVFVYSASEFFVKSWQSLRQKSTTIDVPIALGIAAIFLRSSYEIISGTGQGYFDSGSGLIFFMLIGRWFQDYTFDSLSFERDYKSYFPLTVTAVKNGVEKAVPVYELKVNDKIRIRNSEIIPVDATLINGDAQIDYSFVTGESLPVHSGTGELIFAGGKQTGAIIELLVAKEISQSHLTKLWSNDVSKSGESRFERLVKTLSRYFVVVTIFIATVAAAYWWQKDMHKAINAFTTVLVIACPCALALSAPFTYGNILRRLGRKKIFFRDYHVLERLADINNIVFDKTGTLTENTSSEIRFEGSGLSSLQERMIYSLVRHSSHPLSQLLATHLGGSQSLKITDYKEKVGFGIEGNASGIHVKAGSVEFVTGKVIRQDNNSTRVYISFDGMVAGCFVFQNIYREGIKKLASELQNMQFNLAVISGDSNAERDNLDRLFGSNAKLNFNQSPEDKLKYVKGLQANDGKVLMIGDGLNDAGAFLQSDVGISITDNTNNFTPASDVIMDASQLKNLGRLNKLSRSASRIIIWSFILSLLYNFLGLSYAVTGSLSPLIAAILMPISTISLVLFTVAASTIKGKSLGF